MFGNSHVLRFAVSLLALWDKCAKASGSHLTPFLYAAYVIIGAVAGAAIALLLTWVLLVAFTVLLLARILGQILNQILSHILIGIQIWVLTRILTRILPVALALALALTLEMGLKEPPLQKFALFLTLLPSFLMLLLPHKLIPLQKEVFCIAVQFHIQKIQSLNPLLDFLIDLYARGPSGIVLGKWRNKVHVEGFLKQVLGLPLKLSEAEECHVLQIRFGTFQEDLVSLLFRHDGEVVAADQGQVGEHAHLAVIG